MCTIGPTAIDAYLDHLETNTLSQKAVRQICINSIFRFACNSSIHLCFGYESECMCRHLFCGPMEWLTQLYCLKLDKLVLLSLHTLVLAVSLRQYILIFLKFFLDLFRILENILFTGLSWSWPFNKQRRAAVLGIMDKDTYAGFFLKTWVEQVLLSALVFDFRVVIQFLHNET